MEIALAVLLVLSFPIIAIAGLVIAIGTRERVRVLEQRFADFQKARPISAAAAAASEPPAATVVTPTAGRRSRRGRPRLPHPPIPAGTAPPRPAAAASVPPSPPPPLPPATPPAEPAMGFEERLGTQWTVWVGGVALALGGFFLVRYSIEQGWFGPGMRIIPRRAVRARADRRRRMGAPQGKSSAASADCRPRISRASSPPPAPPSPMPTSGRRSRSTISSARRPPSSCSASSRSATLAAALMHGPALAGLGLVGAYVTPLIVSTGQANFWALYIYLAVVTAAAFLLARARMWRWLAITAVAFGFFWTLPGLALLGKIGVAAHSFHVVVGFALVATFIVSGLLFGPDAEPGKIDPVSSGALAAYLFGALLIVLMSRHDTQALVVFVALTAATVAIAWRTDAAAAAVPFAGVTVALMFLQYSVNVSLEQLVLPSGPTAGAIPEPQRVFYGTHLVLGAGLAALFGAAGFLAQGRSTRAIVPTLWAASAVFVPLAILVALYYPNLRVRAVAALRRACIDAGRAVRARDRNGGSARATSRQRRRRRDLRDRCGRGARLGADIGAGARLAHRRAGVDGAGRRLGCRQASAAGAAHSRRRAGRRRTRAHRVEPRDRRIDQSRHDADLQLALVGLWHSGGGILAWRLFAAAARRRCAGADGGLAALLFTVLLTFLEVRHYMTGGNIYRTSSGLNEIALHVNVGLAMVIGLEWLRQRTHSIIHDIGALIIAALTLGGIVFGLGFAGNPMIWPYNVGGSVFNLILLGYGLPALLTAALALVTRGQRPLAYSQFAAVIAVALALAYLSLQVRRYFHGEVLTIGRTTDAEQYTYSAVWLIFGVALLAVGLVLKSQAVRLASAAVVVLTVLKVFLVDMRDLTGIWQSISLIGLGIVLMGIGLFYQRLLFPRRIPAAPTPT